MVVNSKGPRFIDDDIVISGVSGRFPDCDTVFEFHDKLLKGVDLVKEDDSRWPKGYLGTYPTMGMIKSLRKFDASFFGAHPKLAERTDPIVRVLLQTSFEAIVDAGICPTELRGSETAVVVGVSSNEAADWWSADPDLVNGYEFLGCTRTMYSNRISFVFDLKGPSYTLDSQSSSGLVGIQQGYYMLKNGMVDAVVVAAVNLVLNPHFNIMFQKLNMLSPEGKCKIFDATANGYARSEAGVALIMQRRADARRIYATVVGTGTNCDGYKVDGCQVSSMRSQVDLYKEIYNKFNIDPLDVSYVEAHGYASKDGDATEVNGLTEIFCRGRDTPLLIGCVKSNMGHSEPAGGLVGFVKVLMALENNILPPNIHYSTPNPNIPALKDGRIQVNTNVSVWNGKFVAVNSFGIGGTNSHLVLKANSKEKATTPYIYIPRLLCVSGRTDYSTLSFLKKVKQYEKDNEFCGLLYKIFGCNITHYDYRAFSITESDQDDVIEILGNTETKRRSVCFVFSGMGSQWHGMGRDLLKLSVFKSSLDKCASVLKNEGFDLYNILLTDDKMVFNDVLNSFVGITSIQVALVDVLHELEIYADFIIGHSIGELACAYADGTLTLEQTMLATYWRGRSILLSNIPAGSMAAVGLSFEDVSKRLPSDVYVACHNSSDSVTITGPPDSISKVIKSLQSEGIFAREVNSSGIAFHSRYIVEAGSYFKVTLEKIIIQPKTRSNRWISTSVPQSRWDTPLGKYSSAEYHLNNLLSPVLFQEALTLIPDSCVVIEIAPHALLQPILKSGLGSKCDHIGLVRRNQSTVTNLLTSIGRLYNAGLQPKIEKLYPPVRYPVSRGTPMIQSLIEWDHSQDWFLVTFLTKPAGVQGEVEKEIDVTSSRYKFLLDSVVDDVSVFPVSGYVSIIWEAVSKLQYSSIEAVPLVIENFQIINRCILSRHSPLKFEINILESTEECEIREKGVLVARARVRIPSNIEEEWSSVSTSIPTQNNEYLPLKLADVYQDLHAKGYMYKNSFRAIKFSDNKGETARLAWNNNWVTFIDSMLQLNILRSNKQQHCSINHIEKIILDPQKHFELLTTLKDDTDLTANVNSLNIISCGGVEIRGVKSILVSVRTKQPSPNLEYYSFVPHFSNQEMKWRSALSVAIQLICENDNSVGSVQIAEILFKSTKHVLTPDISDAIDNEPYTLAEFTIYTTSSHRLVNLKLNNVKYVEKNMCCDPVSKDHRVIVVENIMSNSKMLHTLIELTEVGNYILTVEDSSSTITEEEINNLNMKLVLKMPTDRGMYLLLRKPSMWKTPMVVMVKKDSFNWIESVKMALRKHQIDNRQTMLIFHNEEPSGVIGLMKCIRREPFGIGLRCLITDNTIEPYKIVNLKYIDYFRKGLAFNIFKNGEWGSYRRLVPEENELTVEVEHAFIGATEVGNYSSLSYIESRIPFIEMPDYPQHELCYVYYCSIYAHDIRCAAGQLPYDDYTNLTKQGSVLGHEYSGRDSTGRKVFGLVGGGALATTVMADRSLLWDVPKNWTLEQASTVPRVYAVAYYALVLRADVRAGETVYINAGVSGLCVACINIVESLDANVFIGFNNKTEEAYLKSIFPQMNESNLINLEVASFEYQLLEKTGGKGVDVIFDTLNSHKRNMFVASLAKNGRLVEFEKSSTFNESLGCAGTKKNITFHKVSHNTLWVSEASRKYRDEIYELVKHGILAGVVKPITPCNIYTDQQIEEAFNITRSGKYFGKVIIKFRDEEPEERVIPATKLVRAHPSAFMDPGKSYVVTGGLTYVGIQLINWLINKGANKIVVCSPYMPVTGYQFLSLRRWREQNVTVIISNIDASNVKGAENLIRLAIDLAPVYAIFHLATVSCESSFMDSTQNHFELPWKSKFETAKCLDVVSRSLCPYLKYFVGLSDVASTYGMPKMANIGYACCALEMLFEQRKSQNYPATVIQFGIVDTCDDDFTVGFIPQKLENCFKSLPKLLNQSYTFVSSVAIGNKRVKLTNKAELVIQEICDILQIKNVAEVSSMMLQELGLEPVSLVEVKSVFAIFDFKCSEQDICCVTFDKIRAYFQQ